MAKTNFQYEKRQKDLKKKEKKEEKIKRKLDKGNQVEGEPETDADQPPTTIAGGVPEEV